MQTAIQIFDAFYLLCWPVLYPQITGDPFPVLLTTNESSTQSPIELPTVDVPVASPVCCAAVNETGSAMMKLWNQMNNVIFPFIQS